ncbi:MAG: hypothetical protein HC858_05600 [Brachymonas sp.]|nr:hypothetical protein [Brachymonas sp.]
MFTYASHHWAKVMLAISIAVVLTACGGGSDGGSQQPNTPPATPEALAKYQGTWIAGCEPDTTTSTSEIETIVFTVVGANLSAVSKTDYYSGTSCAGSAFASVTDLASSVSFSGTKTVGTDTVDKVTATIPAGTPTFTGTAYIETGAACGSVPSVAVPLGGRLLCSNIPTSTSTAKTILLLSSNGNVLNAGDNDSNRSFDAEGFPNVLDTTDTYNKQ